MNLEKILRYLLLSSMTALLLSGCGMFRTHTDYDKAVEARPLDVPPDLDTPNTAGELIVPPAGAGAGKASTANSNLGSPPASGVSAAQGNGVRVADTVANAWQRVGLALERGKVGTIVSRDEAAHSYAVDVTIAAGPKPGFFKRMLGGKQAISVNRVNVQVDADGDAANVNAQGDPSAVKQVLDVLRERLS